MKGFFIEITNNLLEPKHVKAMGKNSAVWEFMWCIDKITTIDDNGIGWILRKKPINLREIAEELGKNKDNVGKNLKKLARAGYIQIIRTPNGLIIGVNKAKKRFNQKVGHYQTKSSGASDEIVGTDQTKSSVGSDDFVGCNIRQDNTDTVYNTIDNTVDNNNTITEKNNKKPTFYFDFDSEIWIGITDKEMTKWKAKYPDVDFKIELENAGEWLIDNKDKRGGSTKNYRLFLNNWFRKSQNNPRTNYGRSKTNKRRNEEDTGEDEYKHLEHIHYVQ